MLAFGLGTLPMLAAIGMAGLKLRTLFQLQGVRLACGLVILAFGLLGLSRMVHGLPPGWVDVLCLGAGA
jgi:sulfite exporter TauE/SafE